ncbi:hypothetical protein INT44_007534 [Umbelopsis vinacea]|uniref:SERTA domain-containing protein n=1 Tax=Umbelopsis vinacea TaxID=44442 RepID=A0A8H7UBJ8_9FUNG|nr:hypothetical protein INT44_007534 [Umbelopsis vinacea]KAI9284482.1 hypothetical protein BC943DRAFT_338119 [Umbelopsis sp. AD052]
MDPDPYQPQPTTQLHYTIANISLHKLYQIAHGPSLCLRQHVLIRNLLMRGSFDTILKPEPHNSNLHQPAKNIEPAALPSDEDVWLERCFDDLNDTDDDMEDDYNTALDDEPSQPWMYTYHHQRDQEDSSSHNAVVPSFKIQQQQVVLVIPFSQLRDTITSREVGSIVSADDHASTSEKIFSPHQSPLI